MKRKGLWLILAVSLLFNVFFVAGYFQARVLPGGAAVAKDIPDQVARELGLDESQTEVFKKLRTMMAEDAALFDDGIALAQQQLLDAMAADVPDDEQIDEIVQRTADLHHQRRLAGSQRFREFLDVLGPDQRERLKGKMHRRPRHRFGPGRRPPNPERFDLDGDGRIDEAEHAAAQAAIERHEEEMGDRQRKRHERRRELIEQFDANGDGELDPQEREALHEHRKETGWEPPPGYDGRGGRGGRGPRGRGPRGGGPREGGPPPHDEPPPPGER